MSGWKGPCKIIKSSPCAETGLSKPGRKPPPWQGFVPLVLKTSSVLRNAVTFCQDFHWAETPIFHCKPSFDRKISTSYIGKKFNPGPCLELLMEQLNRGFLLKREMPYLKGKKKSGVHKIIELSQTRQGRQVLQGEFTKLDVWARWCQAEYSIARYCIVE